MGVLLTLGRYGRKHGIFVLFTDAAGRVQRLLAVNGLESLLDEAKAHTDRTALTRQAEIGQATSATDGECLRLIAPTELTAVSLQAWRGSVDDALYALPATVRMVEIDTTCMRFIDRAAIGFLIALKKKIESGNRRFLVTHMQPAVRTTMRLARVESLLAGTAQNSVA